jgi:dolichol kinase
MIYYPVYAISIILLLYRVYAGVLEKALKMLLPLIILIIIGSAAFFYEGANPILLASVLVVFDSAAFAYRSKKGIAFGVIAIAYIAYLSNLPTIYLAQAAFLGLLSEAHRLKSENKAQAKDVEINRDIVHMLIGIAVILIFYLLAIQAAEILLIALIVFGYIAGNYVILTKDALSRFLKKLERDYTTFGHGAIWLAIGSLIPLALLSEKGYVITILIAIFIADPVATIFGIKFGKIKIFYNRKKSIIGSLAYFFTVAVLSYPFIGLYSILFAVLVGFVESLPIKIDDNFSVPIALTILAIAVTALTL